jgi:4-hydroxybenzoate polyprenyltransferase
MRDPVKARLGSIGLFLRLPMIGFSLGPAIAGAATGVADVRLATLCQVILLAVLFHVPVMLVNDLIDIRIDRVDPLRTGSPLVLGMISARTTWLIAGTSFVIMTLLAFMLFRSPMPAISLLIGLFAITVYNIWGKSCPFPIATDFIQGIGWSALGYFGALLAGGAERLTYFLCAALLCYTMLLTAYGALRDLRADSAEDGFTTVMLLGARVGQAAPVISRRLAAYLFSLHCVLLGISLSLLLTSHGATKITSSLSLALFFVLLLVAWRASLGVRSENQLHALGAAGITIGFAGIAALSATAHNSFVPAVAFLVFLLPMFVNPAFRNMVRVRVYV